MSYTPSSTSSSSCPSSPNAGRQRSSSHVPLLPTSTSLSDDLVWGSKSQGEWKGGVRRKRPIAISLILGIVLSMVGVAYLAQERQGLFEVNWISDYLGPQTTTLLLPRLSENETFSYYTRPLTNPIEPKWDLDFDDKLTIEHLPSQISASTPSSLIFHCAHSNLTMCASAYRVVFIGPTMRSTPWSDSVALDERRVEVHFQITDPGDYQVYAYPEHEQCHDFQPELHDWKIRPYFKLAVTGSPALLRVDGPATKDGVRACTLEDDLTDGRWISRKHISQEHRLPTSPLFNWVQSHLDPTPSSLKTITDYRKYNYIFANYQCKVQHRSFEEQIEDVKPERLVFIGDSVTRDQFCLNYGVSDQTRGVCLYEKWGSPYEKSDKHITIPRSSDNGTTNLHFHWEPLGDPASTERYIKSLPSPPTHIFFEVALWITQDNGSPLNYVNTMRPLLETLVRVAPNAKITTRTSASAVQAISCWDLRNIRRLVLEPVNKAFVELLKEFPSVKLLDSYHIYDDIPSASEDGRHWERVNADPEWSKPEEGIVTYAMTDLIFERWRLEKERDLFGI